MVGWLVEKKRPAWLIVDDLMETDETDRFFSTAVRLFGAAWRGCRKCYDGIAEKEEEEES